MHWIVCLMAQHFASHGVAVYCHMTALFGAKIRVQGQEELVELLCHLYPPLRSMNNNSGHLVQVDLAATRSGPPVAEAAQT